MKKKINIFLKELNKSKDNQQLLPFYDDKNDLAIFHVGYIQSIFYDSILILTINEIGLEDGCVLLRFEDIYKVEKRSRYLDKMSVPKYSNKSSCLEPLSSKNGIYTVIEYCKISKILLSVKLIYQDYLIGFIEKSDDEIVLLSKYTKTGDFDGDVFIKIEDIQSFAFSREEENSLLKLIELK